jgi:Fe2+ or Zn2+ uptake regulation protein
MNKAKDIINDLKNQGYKETNIRSYLIAMFAKNHNPFTAIEIGKKIAFHYRLVNKTTVYRELQFLSEQGIIIEINFGDNIKRYELAALPHHHHVICKKCKNVEDIYINNKMAQLEKKIQKKSKYIISGHSLEFFGLCRKCQ